jgi:hypothetical protein
MAWAGTDTKRRHGEREKKREVRGRKTRDKILHLGTRQTGRECGLKYVIHSQSPPAKSPLNSELCELARADQRKGGKSVPPFVSYDLILFTF